MIDLELQKYRCLVLLLQKLSCPAKIHDMEDTKNDLFPPLYLESEGGTKVCCGAVQVITAECLILLQQASNTLQPTISEWITERYNVIGISFHIRKRLFDGTLPANNNVIARALQNILLSQKFDRELCKQMTYLTSWEPNGSKDGHETHFYANQTDKPCIF